jgi:hypothetical protein
MLLYRWDVLFCACIEVLTRSSGNQGNIGGREGALRGTKQRQNGAHYKTRGLRHLCFSPNITSAMKHGRWKKHMACMRTKKNAYKILIGKSESGFSLDDPRVYGRIILKWIFQNYDWIHLTRHRDDWRIP